MPLYEKLGPLGDLERIFPAFLDCPRPAFLDSALAMGKLGRYSYITADPFLVVRSKGRRIEIEGDDGVVVEEGDPFRTLQRLLRNWQVASTLGLPPFQGGAVGYFAYELGRHVERLPGQAVDDMRVPELNVGLYDWVLTYDHSVGRGWIVATGLPSGDPAAARWRLDWAKARLRTCQGTEPEPGRPKAQALISNFTRDAYLASVERVLAYITEGDVYQVCLSQRFSADVDFPPWQLYRRLRRASPAPYAAYLGFPEVSVLGSSPEEFLTLDGRRVKTRPIKGTRPRGATEDEDRRLADELLASEKDRAENLMIVDLVRNDVGRVARIGSVAVPALFVVEPHPNVYQLVSTVVADLAEGFDAVDLLRACFPGGSVTGAPKIRAMEIIDELEPTQRSVYCGALGYIGFDGSMLTNMPIRTMLIRGTKACFQVGGGIVADSDPAAEYDETLHKARGALAALGVSVLDLQAVVSTR